MSRLRQSRGGRRIQLDPAQIEAFETDAWFSQVPADRRRMLLDAATAVRLGDGGRLYGSGDDPNGLWAVVEGQVRLLAYPASGAEILIRILGPGGWCGELSTIDGGPRPQDAVAFGPALVLNVSPATFARLAEREPALWRDLSLLGCAHQREALAFIGQRAAQPTIVRLAKALLSASAASGTEAPAIRQAELAVLVGVGRQTLNRYLKRLELSGLVRADYGRFAILDRSGLADLAGRNEV